MSDDISLVISGKDRDYFLSRGIPFPIYWYGYKDLPNNRKKSRAYSTEMRELSDLPVDYIEVIEMFWGLAEVNLDKIKSIDKEFVENIPVPTATRINALVQTKLAMISSEERKEWADRVEGKSVSREVSMALVSEDDGNSTASTRELIMSKFSELESAFEVYNTMASNKLDYTETLKIETTGEENGEAKG